MKWFVFLFIAFLIGCSTGIDPYFYVDREASYKDFEICHAYSCTYRTPVSYSDTQWRQVKKIFKRPAKTPEKERDQILKALSLMEKLTLQSTDLPKDEGEARSRPQNVGQMDCIDETVNMTQYLAFLEKAEFLKHHKVGKPIHRGYFIDGQWPHNAATIVETDSDKRLVVDAFFEETGAQIYMIEPKKWMDNWAPWKD